MHGASRVQHCRRLTSADHQCWTAVLTLLRDPTGAWRLLQAGHRRRHHDCTKTISCEVMHGTWQGIIEMTWGSNQCSRKHVIVDRIRTHCLARRRS
jgi:hypothetical protein